MTDIKPLKSLKQSSKFIFIIIALMSLFIGSVALFLSTALQQRIDNLVNHDTVKITTALRLAKDAQRLQVVTNQLKSFTTESERQQLLQQLSQQWQLLREATQQLQLMPLPEHEQQRLIKFEAKLNKEQSQLPLLNSLTRSALAAKQDIVEKQALLRQHEQQIFQQIQAQLSSYDQQMMSHLQQAPKSTLQAIIHQHQILTALQQQFQSLFANLAKLRHTKDITQINLIQRQSLRQYIQLQQRANESLLPQSTQWFQQLNGFITGQNNLFQLHRNASNTDSIADAHLDLQAKFSQRISDYTLDFVSKGENKLQQRGEQLKQESDWFVVLIFCAGVLYTLVIALTNWRLISQGIIRPVIATSSAMHAIANEKPYHPLPQTNNLELQQMVNALTTLKRYATKVKSISEIDGLTGVFNRRYFDQQLAIEMKKSSDYQQPIAIILFDIDSFKQYNDRYGHVAGDQCLKTITRTIKRVDEINHGTFARYGGEEFVVLMPNCSRDNAFNIAKKMKHAVRLQAIPHEDSEYFGLLTISLGLCCTTVTEQDTPISLIERADQALYLAKRSGRNTIKVNEPD
ncbi:diguanylate cyclase domain-containing protein [Shewanella waksmanii]|uniref:diguanylate cyclase domain-containing protein n=1 Tax=Shewanella waksmanii TaxID=213783 RepID=UPI00373518E4